MKLQAMDYLLKPVKAEELNELLARCVKELDRRNSENGGQNLDLHGFMNVDWIREYQLQRDAIYESLHSDIPTLLHSRFKNLYELISSQKENSVSKSLEICIYFDLHNLLQHFILESGYSLDNVFGEKLPSFVFSNDFSFYDMLDFVESLYAEAKERVEKLVRSQNRVDVRKIKQYIDANYLKGITLEETAARFYISKEYLSKLFKMESGSNFSDYVTDLKMKKARELLLTDRVAIKEIAEMIGYADQPHFYKAFKKYYGMTPGEMLNGIKPGV